ncbi:serine hydrolase-domain-containing protein [Xylariomycetidae sp. FL2044]|nr:serine hydrolase-domain-containing protein [Xylariomycetidae sp. FL2044]KAH9883377.1 serine hydrolase-domain-containing protein [Xylariomycetidae sp. FL2044]KAH9889105.1 serine hydrolase-domain-containing protein [Xylariomycetidae sp. FL2044]
MRLRIVSTRYCYITTHSVHHQAVQIIIPRRLTHSACLPTSLMSAPAPTTAAPPPGPKSNIPKGKKELKILMLHGYTQSGPLFSSKTKALAKLLTKALSPPPLNLHPTLLYPSGPHNLRPSDIPGYDGKGDEEEDEEEEDEETDNWAWFRKDDATGTYRGFEAGMRAVAAAIRDAGGGVDGVIGFSQGAAMAALVAAAMEQSPARSPPAGTPSPSTSSSNSASETTPPEEAAVDWSWLEDLRSANAHQPLRFCVSYSGFYAPVAGLRWLYEDPARIRTPTLHFLGSLDSVVEEGRSRGLVERCEDPTVVVHPGGHYVPVARDWAMPLVAWLRDRCKDVGAERDANAAAAAGKEGASL